MHKRTYQISFTILLTSSLIHSACAGIVISSKQENTSETSIYQKGIAIHLTNGKADTIIDTNTNNCISINHKLKRYLFLKCAEFQTVVSQLHLIKLKKYNKKIPLAVQEMMVGNQPPKTAITIKRSGRGSYQGFHVEKFQFIVDDEVVSEYWMSNQLKEKIDKEIDIMKVERITDSDTLYNFSDGLNAKINKKYHDFAKKQYALKEFKYTGSETNKIYRHVTIRRVKIRKYLPPKSYKLSASVQEFLKGGLEL